jgi:SSS family solute:Na+ symporter
MGLTTIDWLIMLVYFVFVLGIGFALKRSMRTSKDFFQAGRAMPAWVCGLAFLSANLGAQEVIGMGASGAKYGIATSHFYWIGAIPAMVFVGVFMMPFYYGSRARSVPEYLRMRFDEKTRGLNAFLFAFMTVFSSGISMYAMARLIQALHLLDTPFTRMGLPVSLIFHVSIGISALIVLAYILLGGLTSAIYNEVLQFLLIVAGFLPLVWIGLKNVGGWNGLKQTLPGAFTHSWQGMSSSATNPLGVEWYTLVMGLGFVLSFGYWCTDFLVIQRAMAADSQNAARRVPLIAAVPKMLFPFLVILPGLIAIAVVPRFVEQPVPAAHVILASAHGSAAVADPAASNMANLRQGLIPVKTDPGTGRPMIDSNGKPVFDYDLAIPNMLLYFFPSGILGLGLTALLASFMSGMAGNVTAFNTVWTYDIYQSYLNKNASDAHLLWMGRAATVGGILLSVAAAYAVTSFNNIMDALQMVFSFVNGPLFATFLLGMFWKRATGHGAFAGLLAGVTTGLLHIGLTLPVGSGVSVKGGWLGAIHYYPSEMAQNFWTAIFAWVVCFAVTIVVSLATKAPNEKNLVGLVHSLTPKLPDQDLRWYQQPKYLGLAVLAGVLVLNLIFR